MVRMEYCDSANFEDRASLTFINRNLPESVYKVIRSGKKTTIRTEALTLTYNGPDVFNENNLRVEFKMNGRKVVWNPGADESGNLMGTARTLDNADGWILDSSSPLEKGLVSRDAPSNLFRGKGP